MFVHDPHRRDMLVAASRGHGGMAGALQAPVPAPLAPVKAALALAVDAGVGAEQQQQHHQQQQQQQISSSEPRIKAARVMPVYSGLADLASTVEIYKGRCG
jgi:hypothetical protein